MGNLETTVKMLFCRKILSLLMNEDPTRMVQMDYNTTGMI